MKKVLYVITKSNWGGAQKYVFDLATNLPKGDFEVVVAAGGNGPLFEKLSTAGIRTITLKDSSRDINHFADLKVLFSLVSLFRKEKPDVVHINSSKIGGLGAFAARVVGIKKIVFTAHGWPFLEDRPQWQTLTIIFFSWLTAFFATDVIDITKATFERTRNWPLVGSKIHLIHNGIDPSFSLTPNTKIRDKFHKGAVIVGTIGELHSNKNQAMLVDATSVMCSVCYVIVGEGEERAKLEKMIQEYHPLDQGRAKLLGHMDAREALANFDIFALTSKKEGLPYVILEAGLAGLPVIATNVGGISDIIENGKTGVLVPLENKLMEFEKELEALAADPERQKRLGAALREKVLKEFSLEQMLTKTLKVYNMTQETKEHNE